jgi:integrase
LSTGGTKARSVGAAFQLYQQGIDIGLVELAPKTVTTVRSAARVMAATSLPDGRTFGDIRLSRLTWQDIEQLYAAMRASGRSSAWIRRCATILNRTLELARKRGLLDANPAKDAARPRSNRSKPFAPSGEEVRKLLEVARRRDPELADLVTVLVSTGLRKGELLALQWGDVDLVLKEIHVAASVSDGGPGVGVVRRSTKTADWRDVPLTAGAAEALARQLERRRISVGGEPPRAHYLFPGVASGSVPLRPDALANRWASARGSSPVTLLHLRHYAATVMLDAGESYRTVADILGNSESTLRLHYDGRTDVGKRRAISALELGAARTS